MTSKGWIISLSLSAAIWAVIIVAVVQFFNCTGALEDPRGQQVELGSALLEEPNQ